MKKLMGMVTVLLMVFLMFICVAFAEGETVIPDVDCSTGWMGQTTEWVELQGDFDLVYTFDYAGYLSKDELDWHNMVVEFTEEGNWLTIVCNGDGWTVGDVWVRPQNSFTVTEASAKDILKDCSATVEFKREGNTITILGIFEKDGKIGTWKASTDEPALPETLKFHIGGEFCKLTNIKVTGIAAIEN